MAARGATVSWRAMRRRLAPDVEAWQAQQPGASGRGRWLRGALSTVGLIAIIGYLLWDKVPVAALRQELLGADARWLLVAAAIVVVNRFVMAVKWWLILRGDGVRVGLRYLTLVTFVGYFVGRLVPGALGMEAVRVWYLWRDHGIGTAGLASVIVDRASSVAALALVALLALLVFDVALPGRDVIAGVCIALLAGFSLLTLLAPRLATWFRAGGTAVAWSGRWRRRGGELALALSEMQGRRIVLLQSVAVGVAAQVIRGIGIYVVFVALGYPELLPVTLAVAPIVMFLTMVPLGISSIAVGAGAMVFLLEPLGVPAAAGLSASLLADALVLIMVPIGALCFAAGGYWRKQPVPAAPAPGMLAKASAQRSGD